MLCKALRRARCPRRLPPPRPRRPAPSAALSAVAAGAGPGGFPPCWATPRWSSSAAAASPAAGASASSSAFGVAAAALAAASALAVSAATTTSTRCDDAPTRTHTRFFTRAEVAAHTTPDTGIWVIYQDGVYDITDFVEQHPGGVARIMMAAGDSIDPFWRMYQQHLTAEVSAVLAPMRIGSLDPDEPPVPVDLSDPYANDPARHPALLVHKAKPFNAESPVALLAENYLTPNELWYVRHHHPVPQVDPLTFRLTVLEQTDPGTVPAESPEKSYAPATRGLGGLSLERLKTRYPKVTVTATMQCGGNRRAALNAAAKTQGLPWDVGAISTAAWGGARLRDVLADVTGIRTLADAEARGVSHVHFLPLDPPYDASIPIEKALAEHGDVLLAYEMNGAELPPEHGYPIRVVVPGAIGARNVKWVSSIRLSSGESESTWQRGVQYKGFSPNVKKFDASVDPEKALSVQEMPVQSAITTYEREVETDADSVEVSGYAWSGGGRGIVRVDVTADGGQTWHTATLREGNEQAPSRSWAWTLWTASVPVPAECRGKPGTSFRVQCKAVDASYNQQPEKIESVWNLRGILNNSWHSAEVKVVSEEE